MLETDKAWAAGFIDGDGCITIIKDRNNFQCLVDVAQRTPFAINKLQALFGGTVRVTFGSPLNKSGKYWHWRVYASSAANACSEIYPYLVEKKQQAAAIITFQTTKGKAGVEVSTKINEHRSFLYRLVKDLNSGLDAERLSERAPANQSEDAIVRSHANDKHESTVEIAVPAHMSE